MAIEVDLKCEVVGGVSAFVELNDTPSSYSDNAGKKVVVNATENGLEFIDDSSTNFDSQAVHVDIANEINEIPEKSNPVAGDKIIIEDSEDSNNKKSVDIENLVSSGGDVSSSISSSTNGAVARFDGLTGKLIDAAPLTFISDTGIVDTNFGYRINGAQPGETGIVREGSNVRVKYNDRDYFTFTTSGIGVRAFGSVGFSVIEGISSNTIFTCQSDGEVGFGITEPLQDFHVNKQMRFDVVPQDDAATQIIARDSNNDVVYIEKSTIGSSVFPVEFVKSGAVTNVVVLETHSSFTFSSGKFLGGTEPLSLVGIVADAGTWNRTQTGDLVIQVRSELPDSPIQHTVGGGTLVYEQIIKSGTGSVPTTFGLGEQFSFAPVPLTLGRKYYVDVSQASFYTVNDFGVTLLIKRG